MSKKKIKKKIIKKKLFKKKISPKVVGKKNLKSKKNENLVNVKNNEQQKEIKKIKKQPTEKKLFNIKDFIVYPKHGVGQIISVNKETIGNIEINFYKVLITKDRLTLSIPINQQSHLRAVCSINQVNKAISILKSKPKVKRTMWSRRAQEYEQKINSGKIYDLAEVVRDLNKDTGILAEQSYSERQLFEKAYDRLVGEFEIVLGLDRENTEKKVNKALKRNQNIIEE